MFERPLSLAEAAVDGRVLDERRRASLRPGRGRKLVVAVTVIDVLAVLNIVVCIASLVRGDGSLSLLTGLIAGGLVMAVATLARFHDGPVRAQHHRPETSGPGGTG